MKLTKEDMLELATWLEEIENFRPLVRLALDAINSYSSELAELPEKLMQWMREENVKSIKFYTENNIDYKDAVALALSDHSKLVQVLKNSKVSYSNKSDE